MRSQLRTENSIDEVVEMIATWTYIIKVTNHGSLETLLARRTQSIEHHYASEIASVKYYEY